MASRRAVLLVCALTVGLLAGCDDGAQPAPQRRDATPEVAEEAGLNATAQSLIDAINTPQLAGGELESSSDEIELEVKPGGTATGETRVRNVGDMPVTISAIDTAVRSGGIAFSLEGCRAGTVLQPQEACDLFVDYTDSNGRDHDNEIVIASDAKQSPVLRIEFSASVTEPPPPPDSGLSAASAPRRINLPLDQIAAINQQRRVAGWGITASARPVPRRVERDERYPEDMFPWAETTLPIDRRRILTADRVIRAVLETPFNNVMCSQVVAVIDQDVYGVGGFPGRDQPLLPAGTRVIGTCDAFTDERAGVVWTRFITPSGVSAKIIGAANDAMGRGGLPGHLDRRWFDKYGVPIVFSGLRSMLEYLLMSGQEATTTVTNPEQGTTVDTQSPESQAMERFQDDLTRILDSVMKDLQDTQEVLTVPGGTRLEIVLGQDIYFKDPYTVVALDGVEYELAESERQVIRRAAPPSYVARPSSGAAVPPGAQRVVIEGKSYVLMPMPAGAQDEDSRSTGASATTYRSEPYASSPYAYDPYQYDPFGGYDGSESTIRVDDPPEIEGLRPPY